MSRVDRFNFKGIATREDILKIEREKQESTWPSSTYNAIHDSMSDNPNEPALSFFMLGNEYKKPFTFTYSELISEINKIANQLHKLGVGKGDAIGLVMPNLPETCFSLIAAQTVGIAFPINPLLDKKHLKELMIAAQVKVIITIGPFVKTDVWEKINAIRHEIPTLKNVIQVDMNQYLRGVKKGIVGLIKSFKDSGKSTKQQKLHNYRSLVGKESNAALSFELYNLAEDPAAYFHTGGTTGRPKIAIQTQENICFDCWSTGQNLDTGMDSLNMYGGLPLFHVFGAMVTLSLCWAGSGHLILVSPKGFRGDGVISNFWETMDYHNINALGAVPAVYKMLNDTPNNTGSSQLKFAISGAAPLPIEVMKTFKSKCGVEILEGYGCTEAAAMVSVNPPYGIKKLGSVGFPIPFTEIKILLLEGDSIIEAETGTIGQVHLRGKNIFNGYLEEEHNKGVWTEFNGKTFYNSGDLGRFDEDGYLWLTGREKELIIRGGHNIDPMSIEDPMYAHPEIEMVAAVGRPDSRVGEVPVLYVQLKPKAISSEKELLEFAKEHINEKAAVPKRIIIIDEIPLTTIGKIFKPDLCKLQIEEVYKEAMPDHLKDIPLAVVNSKSKGRVVEIRGLTVVEQEKVKELLGAFEVPVIFLN
ncbi:MAG: fatty-acyl-CoA synthase [Parvicellaceae bacterium]|jgi:fatty-acyl-CoA synthase